MSHKLLLKAGFVSAVWVSQAIIQVFVWDADFRGDVASAVGIYSQKDKDALACSSFDLLPSTGQFLSNPVRSDASLLYFPLSQDSCTNGRSPIAYLLGSDLVPYAWADARWDGTLWRLIKLK